MNPVLPYDITCPTDHDQSWGYSVSMLDNFLLKLFDKYAELLKERFSVDFQEVSER